MRRPRAWLAVRRKFAGPRAPGHAESRAIPPAAWSSPKILKPACLGWPACFAEKQGVLRSIARECRQSGHDIFRPGNRPGRHPSSAAQYRAALEPGNGVADDSARPPLSRAAPLEDGSKEW